LVVTPEAIGELSGYLDEGPQSPGGPAFLSAEQGRKAWGSGFGIEVRPSAYRNHVGLIAGGAGMRVLAWLGELADCQAALRRIADGDESGIRHLNTPFAMAVWDGRDRSLRLCGDRYGNQPFYYGRRGARFTFSTRASSVPAMLGLKPTLDLDTLGELMWFGHPVSERTLYEGVSRLPPATRLVIQDGRCLREAYWRPHFTSLPAQHSRALLDDTCAAFVSAVGRTTQEEDTAIALTGGQDTRAILAATLALGRKVSGFTAGVPGSMDLTVAHRLGSRLAGRHHELQLGAGFALGYPALARELVSLTEGALGIEHAHNIHLSHHCHGRFRALVDGGGAEACKRGFLRRAASGRHANSEAVDLIVTRCGRSDVAAALLPRAKARDLENAMCTTVGDLVRQHEHDDLADTLDAYFLRVHQANFGARAFALQSHFIEGRLPFLDYDFVDRVMRLPRKMRERSAVQCGVVGKMLPSLRGHGRVFCDVLIPWTEEKHIKYALTGLGRVASRARLPIRPRQPCFPFDRWWRESLTAETAERVETFAGRGLLDADRVMDIARRCRSGATEVLPAAELLWRLELWHELFIDGGAEPQTTP
jgi:asparagine synthetase B (glutamine-hydrolysing)